MSDLHTITTPVAIEPGVYSFDVPEGWQQGRGAFGGLVIAMLVRAIEAHVAAPDRRLRALDAELPGATLTGPATVRVETLRAGSGVSTVAARLIQDNEVRAHAVGVLGRTRGSDAAITEVAAPSPPPWRETPPLSTDALGPTFTRHFEMRNVGPLPFMGAGESTCAGWVCARNPGPISEAARVAAYVDVWWPAVFARMTEPRPVGTISYALHVISSLEGLDPEVPMFHRGRALATVDGYSVEHRELWGDDGRLVALNSQTIAIIR